MCWILDGQASHGKSSLLIYKLQLCIDLLQCFFNGFQTFIESSFFYTPGLSYFDVEIMGLSPVFLSTRYDCLCPSLFCLIGILPPIWLMFLFVNFLNLGSYPSDMSSIFTFGLAD